MQPMEPNQANYCGKPDSTSCPCNCKAIIEVSGLGMVDFFSVGSMTIRSTSADRVHGICTTYQRVEAFEVAGAFAALGEIRIALNEEADVVSPSTMVNLVPGLRFPARHDVYAHATMTVQDMPGVEFHSRPKTPFHMACEVTSYPAIDETYHLVERVEFVNRDAPDDVVAIAWAAKILVGPTRGLSAIDDADGRDKIPS